jgi:hypothetical protein
MRLPFFVRLYFGTVGIFAAFVGSVGLFAPPLIDHAIPWAVAPLHARMIGALYLGGMVLMFGAARQPLPRVWAMLPLATVWTGVLLFVSLLWLDTFTWAFWPVRFWWFAYLVFPVAGTWLTMRQSGQPMPGRWPVSALALAVLATGLLLWPEQAARVWPWPLPPLLAQVYSGPLFGIAAGLAFSARRALPEERRLLSLGLAVMAGAALLASLVHLPLFTATNPATWVWFGGLGLALVRSGRILLTPETT